VSGGSNFELRREQLFAALLALCAGLLAVGCSGSSRQQDVLVVGIEAAPTDLDPRFATDASSARIDELVFRSLTRVDERHQHVPDLATDWRLEGPLVVRFDLRADATFSDGSPLVAADVRANGPGRRAPSQFRWRGRSPRAAGGRLPRARVPRFASPPR